MPRRPTRDDDQRHRRRVGDLEDHVLQALRGQTRLFQCRGDSASRRSSRRPRGHTRTDQTVRRCEGDRGDPRGMAARPDLAQIGYGDASRSNSGRRPLPAPVDSSRRSALDAAENRRPRTWMPASIQPRGSCCLQPDRAGRSAQLTSCCRRSCPGGGSVAGTRRHSKRSASPSPECDPNLLQRVSPEPDLRKWRLPRGRHGLPRELVTARASVNALRPVVSDRHQGLRRDHGRPTSSSRQSRPRDLLRTLRDKRAWPGGPPAPQRRPRRKVRGSYSESGGAGAGATGTITTTWLCSRRSGRGEVHDG